MPNQKYTFERVEEEGGFVIKAWRAGRREGIPDAITRIDLDAEDVQSEIFRQLMRERLMKSESKEGQDITQCDKAEAIDIVKGIELNKKKIAETDIEAEAILEYQVTNQIYEHKSGKVILLDDLASFKHTKKLQRFSRWPLFLDTVIDILSKGKEKAEAIKRKYEEALEDIEKKGPTISIADKIKGYLEIISRLGKKERDTGELTIKERNTLNRAYNKLSIWKEREKVGPDALRDDLKELINEGFETHISYLEDADYVISVLTTTKNDIVRYIGIKNVEEIESYQGMLLTIANSIKIPITPTEITPEEFQKYVEEYNLDMEDVKRGMEIVKEGARKVEKEIVV